MLHKFKFEPTKFDQAFIIEPQYIEDNRGMHLKDYHKQVFEKNTINHTINEIFYTYSHVGVIRALHYQEGRQQAKVVRCIKGAIYDVIVDLRRESATYLQWESYFLNETNRKAIYVPKEFAHGYLVLEESIVIYECDETFYQQGDTGIRWNDPTIGIDWPYELVGGQEHIIMSKKDCELPYWRE